MFSGLPRRHQTRVRASVAVAWALSAAAGLSAAVAPEQGFPLGVEAAFVTGIALVVCAGAAAIGVMINRYRLEWVSAWLAAGSIVPLTVVLWAIAITQSLSFLSDALFVTSLLAFFLSRAALCAAHAAKLREAHDQSIAVIEAVMPDPGEAADGLRSNAD